MTGGTSVYDLNDRQPVPNREGCRVWEFQYLSCMKELYSWICEKVLGIVMPT